MPDRPPLGSRSASGGGGGEAGRPPGEQPRAGVKGLLVVGTVSALLVFGWGGAEATFHVLGVLVVFALPVAGVIALWWEDWPGAELRPRWSGVVDTAIVAGGGVLLALVAQMVPQRPDPAVLLVPEVSPARTAAFPALVPLGVAVFTVFLQITLVTEGWPLRRLGRLGGGGAALVVSWVVGLVVERLLLPSGTVTAEAFLGVLGCVSAVQVLGWVVPPAALLGGVGSRTVRLLVGNAATIAIGLGAYFLVDGLVNDGATVGALAAGTVGAGLVVGMLFEAWPVNRLGGTVAKVAAILMTLVLAVLGVEVCRTLARVLGLAPDEAAAWSTYALDAVAAAVILHVGIFRRWPMAAAS